MRKIQVYVPEGQHTTQYLERQVERLQRAIHGWRIEDEHEDPAYWEIDFGAERMVLRQHGNTLCISLHPFEQTHVVPASMLEVWLRENATVTANSIYCNLLEMKAIEAFDVMVRAWEDESKECSQARKMDLLNRMLWHIDMEDTGRNELWLTGCNTRLNDYAEKVMDLLELAQVRVIHGVQPMSKLDEEVKRMLNEAASQHTSASV